jgi:hypothetical protein
VDGPSMGIWPATTSGVAAEKGDRFEHNGRGSGSGVKRFPACEEVRLTGGARKAPGPTWQRPEEAYGVGCLHTWRWAGVDAELGWLRRKTAHGNFSNLNIFSN